MTGASAAGFRLDVLCSMPSLQVFLQPVAVLCSFLSEFTEMWPFTPLSCYYSGMCLFFLLLQHGHTHTFPLCKVRNLDT